MLSRARKILGLSLSQKSRPSNPESEISFKQILEPLSVQCPVSSSCTQNFTTTNSDDKVASTPDIMPSLPEEAAVSLDEYVLAPTTSESLPVLNISDIEVTDQSVQEFANVDIHQYLYANQLESEIDLGMSVEVISVKPEINVINDYNNMSMKTEIEQPQQTYEIPVPVPSEVTDHSYLNPSSKVNVGCKRMITKGKRVRGESYVGFKRSKDGRITHTTDRSARSVKERCNHTTLEPLTPRTFLCAKVTDEIRQKQHEYLWSLPTWEAKQAYIKGNQL